jgi:hypothetical protein
LAIGRPQLAFDETTGAEQPHHRGHGLRERLGTDAVADVPEGLLAWDGVVQASQVPLTTPVVLGVQLITEAGIIDVLLPLGGSR